MHRTNGPNRPGNAPQGAFVAPLLRTGGTLGHERAHKLPHRASHKASHKASSNRLAPAALFTLAVGLAGCTNLSGLGGSSDFQCKAPDGVPCQSISGVHHNERSGNLPFQRPARSATHELQPAVAATAPGRISTSSETAGIVAGGQGEGFGTQAREAAALPAQASLPLYRKASVSSPHRIGPGGFGAIRSDPVVIRMWVAPWEDADGDLNDQTYVYLQVDSGRWLIEHNRAQVRREFAPRSAEGATPLVSAPTTGKAPAAPGADSPQAIRPKMPPEAMEALRRAAQQGAAKGAEGPAPATQGGGGSQGSQNSQSGDGAPGGRP
jgi:conjugal transfer pilus assembly protein TraV